MRRNRGRRGKKREKSGIERKGEGEGGRQLRNLLATPASCQRSVETDTFFPLPRLSHQSVSSSVFSSFPFFFFFIRRP